MRLSHMNIFLKEHELIGRSEAYAAGFSDKNIPKNRDRTLDWIHINIPL